MSYDIENEYVRCKYKDFHYDLYKVNVKGQHKYDYKEFSNPEHLRKEIEIFNTISDDKDITKIYDVVEGGIITDRITTMTTLQMYVRSHNLKIGIQMLIKVFDLIERLASRQVYFIHDVYYSIFVINGERPIISDLFLATTEDTQENREEVVRTCTLLLDNLFSIKFKNINSIEILKSKLMYKEFYPNTIRDNYNDTEVLLNIISGAEDKWNRKRLVLTKANLNEVMLTYKRDYIFWWYKESENLNVEDYIKYLNTLLSLKGNTFGELEKSVKRKRRVIYKIDDIVSVEYMDTEKKRVHMELCFVLYYLFINYYSNIISSTSIIFGLQNICVYRDEEEDDIVIIRDYEIDTSITEFGALELAKDMFIGFMQLYSNTKLYTDIMDKKYGTVEDMRNHINKLYKNKTYKKDYLSTFNMTE